MAATHACAPQANDKLQTLLAATAQHFGAAAAQPVSYFDSAAFEAKAAAERAERTQRWNDGLRSIAFELLDGEDASLRIAQLARAFKVDIHTATLAAEDLADQLR